jgi:hypothetical protein
MEIFISHAKLRRRILIIGSGVLITEFHAVPFDANTEINFDGEGSRLCGETESRNT